jgi:hypothetical protein
MANQQKLAKTLEELQTLITRLKSGDLQLNELESLVLGARELYELSLVLRYKAYEQQVQGLASEVTEENIILNSEISEVPFLVGSEESMQEEMVQPAIEFSLFDEPLHTPLLETEEKIKDDSFEAPEGNTEPDQEEDSFVEAEVPVTQTTIVTEEWSVEQTPVAENDDFVRRFSAIDASLQHQLVMSRLETLIGSFGLNERLQFINELFDGSSEAFSEAIKSIDSQSDQNAALRKASALARQFNWDSESETVEEFVLKIKRRYA